MHQNSRCNERVRHRLVVTVICSPVSKQEIQGSLKCYPYLQGLQLACGTVSTVSVDLLIRVDYYWSFFTGGIIKGDPSGPVALETRAVGMGSVMTCCNSSINRVMHC